jgi:hypothetical protein
MRAHWIEIGEDIETAAARLTALVAFGFDRAVLTRLRCRTLDGGRCSTVGGFRSVARSCATARDAYFAWRIDAPTLDAGQSAWPGFCSSQTTGSRMRTGRTKRRTLWSTIGATSPWLPVPAGVPVAG